MGIQRNIDVFVLLMQDLIDIFGINNSIFGCCNFIFNISKHII